MPKVGEKEATMGVMHATVIDVEAWITVSEAGRRLGYSVAWIRALGDRGELVMIKTALGRLVLADSARAYNRRRRQHDITPNAA
jgi:hypothetical protein